MISVFADAIWNFDPTASCCFGATTCCYAKSEKSWIGDPTGISWETFQTTGESTLYGDSSKARSGEARIAHNTSCCAPGAAHAQEKAPL